MQMNKAAFPISALALLFAAGFGASAQEPPTDTGIDVDPQAYVGLWHEVARTPAPFQQRCDGGTTAHYEVVDDETLSVVNSCDLSGGEFERVEGTATVLNARFNAFDVEFPQSPPEEGPNYLIHALGPIEDGEYAWAVVRGPGEGYGWILSREPELDSDAFETAKDALVETGIDPDRRQMTSQPPRNYNPEDL
jgi:apolipoprotein D and lipocalin family protein